MTKHDGLYCAEIYFLPKDNLLRADRVSTATPRQHTNQRRDTRKRDFSLQEGINEVLSGNNCGQ